MVGAAFIEWTHGIAAERQPLESHFHSTLSQPDHECDRRRPGPPAFSHRDWNSGS